MSIEVQIRKKEQNRTLDVSFATEGRILTLLGAAGSGKTQVLRLLAGLEAPDEGSILLNGEKVFDSLGGIRNWKKHRIVLLPRGYALFPELTVEENIRLVLGENENRSEKKGRKLLISTKTAQLLSEYGLDGLGGCRPCELSAPQQLMAAMARTMAAKPELVLLDNPFAGLDPYLRAQLLQTIRDKLLKAGGPGVVLATPDPDEAYAMGGEIACLEEGRCLGVKERELFFREPRTVGAALLSGCHNIAEAVRLDDWHALVPDWGAVFVFLKKKHAAPGKEDSAEGKKEGTGEHSGQEAALEQTGHRWEKLPAEPLFLGIREENFLRELPEGARKEEYFRFRVHVMRIEEDLWNWNIFFCTGRTARLMEKKHPSQETVSGEASGERSEASERKLSQGREFEKDAEAPAPALLLWKVSKREMTRKEIGKIKRLYVENRQIMRLTGEKGK